MRGLARALQPVRQAVRLMVARAVLLIVNDGLGLQGLQISLLADETRDDVERFQDYGFTSHPLPGAEAVAVGVGGSRDHLVVIKVDDRRYRLKGLQAGEVAIYTDEGDKIVLKRGGIVEVMAATKVSIVAPLVECSAALHVVGSITSGANITAAGNVADQGGAKTMAGMRGAYNGHTHGASPLPSAGM
jgi:phage baseplate assembly protein V